MKRIILIAAAGLLICAGAALGNSLSVTSAAAMGGVAQNNCSGDGMPGPCGLAVFHDNTSRAFVRDDSLTAETLYRASFLFNPNNLSQNLGGFRQVILDVRGDNPNVGVGNCPATPGITVAIRVWLRLENFDGSIYRLQAEGRGNQCGKRSTPKFDIAADQPVRICLEHATGGGGTGFLAIAGVDPANPCPPSGDAAYRSVNYSNQLVTLDHVRMGTPATNNFGVSQNGTMYFDEFESFRTLAP